MSLRILLADDEPLVRAGIALLLTTEPGMEVVEAGDGMEAIHKAERETFDVVVMDVRMPVMDGVEATRRLAGMGSAASPTPPVLVLTTFREDQAVFAALRAGACGFLLKDAAPAELVEAVRSLARGEGWLDPSVTRSLIREFAVAAPGVAATPNAHSRDPSFRREGEYWTIAYQGSVVRLRNSVGLGYIETLLKNPGREFHALALAESSFGDLQREERSLEGSGDLRAGREHAGPLLDATAKRSYRNRIQELRDEIEEISEWADAERTARLNAELQMIEEEISRSVGLGGRDRFAASRVERARVRVTKAVRHALKHISAAHPELGRHLEHSIQTGAYCSYRPEFPGAAWH